MAGRKKTTLEVRFWEKVQKTDGCWLWTAGHNGLGYGTFRIGQARDYAHRVSWRLSGRETTPGMDLCHRCDNPACVNPDHLFEGTRGDNMRDASRKGRLRTGPGNPQTKLSMFEVFCMRNAWAMRELSQNQMARMFGVTQSCVSDVVNFRTWKLIGGPGRKS